MKTIEVTAQYKLGHSTMRMRTFLAVRNINYIQEMVEEVPEYTDGVSARVVLANGEMIPVVDRYTELSSTYQQAMNEEA